MDVRARLAADIEAKIMEYLEAGECGTQVSLAATADALSAIQNRLDQQGHYTGVGRYAAAVAALRRIIW